MSGERRNNQADMSISEQIEAIKTEVCDKYCRFPQAVHEMWLRGEIEHEECADKLATDYCTSCPLTRL